MMQVLRSYQFKVGYAFMHSTLTMLNVKEQLAVTVE